MKTDKLKKRIKLFWCKNKNVFIYSLVSAIVFSLAAYFRIFYTTIANSDGLIEGYRYYTNANWATSGCGRWLIRYINLLHGNRVIPQLILIETCFFNWLTSFIIIKILNIKKRISAMIIGAVLCITPSTISQLSYTCVALSFAVAGTLAALYALSCKSSTWYVNLAGPIFLAFSIGAYQSYIGLAAQLILFALIIDIFDNGLRKNQILFIFKSALSAIIGALLYLVFFKLELKRYGLSASSRAAQFSISEIKSFFIERVIYTYQSYFKVLFDNILFRNLILTALFGICLVIIVSFICNFKAKKHTHIIRLILVLLMCLIPLLSNVIAIIVPFNEITLIMSQQSWLFIPLISTLLEKVNYKIIKCGFVFTTVLLMFSYIVSANATYISYGKSYDFINQEMSTIVGKIRNIEGYKENETKILLVGFPDDKQIRKDNKSYDYAIDMPINVVFWEDLTGTIYARKAYFENFMYINAGDLSEEEYRYLISLEEVQKMNCWPEDGSIALIDGYIVVKIENEYY